MTILLKGNPIAKLMYAGFREEAEDLRQNGTIPALKVIISSDDPAIESYYGMISKNCVKSGIECSADRFSENTGTQDIINSLSVLNADENIHGILVMLPLWKGIDEKKVITSISASKDIDGVNPLNAGKLVLGEDTFAPNTAQACIDLLEGSGIGLSGKHVVIIGRSNIVGKPLANMLLKKGVDATVTVCHSRTENLKAVCRTADILIAAIGSPSFVTKDFTHPDQIIVDVGMNEIKKEDGSYGLAGDVDFENVKDHVKAVTPVPGGVSPLTHTALMKNILKAVKLQIK